VMCATMYLMLEVPDVMRRLCSVAAGIKKLQG
jgi:hypothetical protein